MAWTTPKDWSTGEVLTAADMDTYVSDNLAELKDPPSEQYTCDEASDYTTTSTSFVDVDATNLSLSITTNGGDLMVGFVAPVGLDSQNAYIYFTIAIDGTPKFADDGLVYGHRIATQVKFNTLSATALLTNLSAGTYTISLQWKVSSGDTATFYAGAGTSSVDMHPQFWVREVS